MRCLGLRLCAQLVGLYLLVSPEGVAASGVQNGSQAKSTERPSFVRMGKAEIFRCSGPKPIRFSSKPIADCSSQTKQEIFYPVFSSGNSPGGRQNDTDLGVATKETKLLCNGTLFLGGQPATGSILVRLLDQKYMVVETLKGDAVGEIQSRPKIYTADIKTYAGDRYAATLDRYTGDFLLVILDKDGKSVGQAEFTGTCGKAAPKF